MITDLGILTLGIEIILALDFLHNFQGDNLSITVRFCQVDNLKYGQLWFVWLSINHEGSPAQISRDGITTDKEILVDGRDITCPASENLLYM